MDIKIEIKEEVPFTDITSHIETQFVPKDHAVKMNDISERKSDTEVNIKEETHFSSLPLKLEEKLLDQDPVSVLSEREIKIEIKEEEDLWLEKNSTEISYAYDDLKDVADEHFLSIESSRSQIRATSGSKSALFLNECLEKHITLNTRKAIPDHEEARKFETQMSDTEIPLIQSSVFSNYSDGKKTASINSVDDSSEVEFNQVSLAKATNLMHDSKKPTKCDVHNLEIAKLARMIINKKLHKCNICGNEFTQFSHMKRHRLIHEGRRPHKCDICGKDFTTPSTLKMHKLIHEGKKPHKCDVCGKSFIHLHQLKSHKLIHEGKRPHVCNICNKDFTQFITLKMHKLIHEDRKLHKCDICNEVFNQFSNLAKHIKVIHEGQKL